MKKFTIIIFLVLAILSTQAQDYLISFEGSGATTMVSTIKVNNLTSGATVTLYGEDTLHLTTATGISTLQSDNGTLQIYPNPMAGQAILTFDAPETGNADICIVDVCGKTVNQISTMLSHGTHSFRISSLSQGMYSVKVTGKNYNYSTKLISQGNLQSQARIEYVSSVTIPTDSRVKSAAATIDMLYTEGDLLLYKGTSEQYSTIVTDVPTSSKTITFNFVLCQDSDGNNYTIVKIDNQTWMAENLNVGARINGSGNQNNNSIIEKYCYDDNDANCAVYGGLYQWYESMQYSTTPGVKGICPTGWHFPTDAEWTTLTTYLGGESIAGGKMKETDTTHWLSPNTGATNSTGFTAVPAGYRNYYGLFYRIGDTGYWWSSSEYSTISTWGRRLLYNNIDVYRFPYNKNLGYSVRCIRD